MLKVSLIVLLLAMCATNVLSRPGYGAVDQKSQHTSGYGGDHDDVQRVVHGGYGGQEQSSGIGHHGTEHGRHREDHHDHDRHREDHIDHNDRHHHEGHSGHIHDDHKHSIGHDERRHHGAVFSHDNHKHAAGARCEEEEKYRESLESSEEHHHKGSSKHHHDKDHRAVPNLGY